MLRVLVIGYNKMLCSLISGAIFKGHKVVGAMRVDRVNYSKFALFLKDIFAPSHDFSILKAFGVYDIKAPSVNSEEFIRANTAQLTVILLYYQGIAAQILIFGR